MRLLLDAHISRRIVGRPLQRRGHDLRAIDAERALQALPDHEVLALAALEGRILVTFDVKDFVPLLREWAEGGKSHAGCVLVVGMRPGELGALIRALTAKLGELPDEESWRDRVVYLSGLTGSASG